MLQNAASFEKKKRKKKRNKHRPFYWLGLGLGSFVYFRAIQCIFDVAEPSLEHEGIIGAKSVAKNKV